MRVMLGNNTGWFVHCLARETGKIGHLFSPDANRGPYPWIPYALDNGAFSCWDMKANAFNGEKWTATYEAWKKLIYWSSTATQKPLWAIAPDYPGNAAGTIVKWKAHVQQVIDAEIPPAIAVQNGMTVEMVKDLYPSPVVICVGGTTEWKWETIELWAKSFSRVHLLRCNMPSKLQYLEDLGVESCDGTGWLRGDARQVRGLETWARRNPEPKMFSLSPSMFRTPKNGQQEWAFGDSEATQVTESKAS